jgi:hypothetical protein
MFTTNVALVPQYTTWDVTGQSNLQVSVHPIITTVPYAPENGTTATVTSNNFVESSTVGAIWTTGNENVDYTVDKPYVGLQIEVNGVTISYDQQLLVTAPSIKFDIQGRDPMQLYVNQSNTVTAIALDAHTQPLKNAMVGVAGNIWADWSFLYDYYLEAGGRTGADGKVTFTFTPKYIGNYKFMLADSVGNILKRAYVPSVAAPADTTAPVVTITAPADASTVSTSTVTVTGSVTDNVGVTSVYINDVTSVTLKPDGTFAAVVTLNEGANTIKVTAFDAAGNKTEKSVAVTYTKPVVKQTVIVLYIGSDIMTVNGNAVQLEAAPEIKNGSTFLPLRAIAEAFGATVNYNVLDDGSIGVTVTLGNKTIGLQTGNSSAVVNGNVVSVVPPYIKNGRTMVPVRVISEGFGAIVGWDGVNKVVTITLAQ